MARVVVTGGAASSARISCARCSSAATTVRVLDNFSTGNRANLDGLDVEIVEGELRSYERVHNAVRKAEVVYHLGALGSVPRSVQDPLTSSAVNVEGTLNVLLAARDEGVRRVVFSSSTSVYGSSRQLPDAGGRAVRPDLAVRRREARRRALLHQLQPRLRVVRDGRAALLQRVRPAAEPVLAVRGRRCRSSSRAIAAGEPVTVYGDGEQSRDFTYVDNVVDATLRARRDRRRQRRDLQRRRGRARDRERGRRHDRRRSSASRSTRCTCRRAPATSATRGPTSRRRSACSATRRRSTSRKACGARSSFSSGRERLAARKRDERVPARLLLAGGRLETGLPAAEGGLVLDEEPEHHVDARVLARDRVGLLQVQRLLRPARRRRSSCRAGSSGSRTR